MSPKNTAEILQLIMSDWQKERDSSAHEIVFPRLIHSINPLNASDALIQKPVN